MPIALLALFLCAFAIGTTEFAIAGLLPEVSGDLAVSVPVGGFLITAYAIGIAFGGPVLAIALSRIKGRTALLVLMAAFTIGQAACALAPNYPAMLFARVAVACTHGAIFGVGAIVATRLVEPERAGRAVSLLLAGVTTANVLGVPAGTALGGLFGWRSTFWAIAVLGAIAVAATLVLIPAHLKNESALPKLSAQVHVLGRQQVTLTFAVLVLGMSAQFALLTYIVPFLETLSGVGVATIPLVLFLFGVGSTVGVVVGGRLSDWRLMPSLIGIVTVQVAIYVLLFAVSRDAVLTIVAVTLWGAAAYAFGAPAQARILAATHDAPNLASTLIPSAYNVGIALGSLVGGGVLQIHGEFAVLPLVGCIASLGALAVAIVSWRLDRRSRRTTILANARAAS